MQAAASSGPDDERYHCLSEVRDSPKSDPNALQCGTTFLNCLAAASDSNMLVAAIILATALPLVLLYARRLWHISNNHAIVAERYGQIFDAIRREVAGTSHAANVELIVVEGMMEE